MITILGSIVNVITGLVRLVKEHENLHSNNKFNIHVSPESYEESGHCLDLDLLPILTPKPFVNHPRGSGKAHDQIRWHLMKLEPGC